jgi:Kef-type K+ transport system membrane component KefB
MILFGFAFSRFVLVRMIRRFDKIQEYIFLVAIGWCLGMAELAEALGLSAEIGAFIAGVALASNPIALFIALNLKPLRDFFLVMFFFSLGAGLNPEHVQEVALPGILLAGLLLLFKPWVFRFLLVRQGERPALGMEIGVRLGQISEFGFLIALLALRSNFIQSRTFYLIEVAIVVSFMVSSFWVVQRYPTPIALSDRLRRD